jgi:hypothetical protein
MSRSDDRTPQGRPFDTRIGSQVRDGLYLVLLDISEREFAAPLRRLTQRTHQFTGVALAEPRNRKTSEFIGNL